MAIGSDNEESVIMAIQSSDWLISLYSVGLLASKWDEYFAVSPDGIGIIKVGDKQQMATIEIKTRVAADTIAFAMSAAEKQTTGAPAS